MCDFKAVSPVEPGQGEEQGVPHEGGPSLFLKCIIHLTSSTILTAASYRSSRAIQYLQAVEAAECRCIGEGVSFIKEYGDGHGGTGLKLRNCGRKSWTGPATWIHCSKWNRAHSPFQRDSDPSTPLGPSPLHPLPDCADHCPVLWCDEMG